MKKLVVVMLAATLWTVLSFALGLVVAKYVMTHDFGEMSTAKGFYFLKGQYVDRALLEVLIESGLVTEEEYHAKRIAAEEEKRSILP